MTRLSEFITTVFVVVGISAAKLSSKAEAMMFFAEKLSELMTFRVFAYISVLTVGDVSAFTAPVAVICILPNLFDVLPTSPANVISLPVKVNHEKW